MKDLSLHILDIIQNSIRAEANLIELYIEENKKENFLKILVIDNGCGMSKEMVEKVVDPFFTTRTTRKVGLGLPLLKQNAERTNGYLKIDSTIGKGTKLEVVFEYNNIDRPPLGDLASTLITLIVCNSEINFLYTHKTDTGEFTFDTREIKAVLEDVPINSPDIINYLKNLIKENLEEINAEK